VFVVDLVTGISPLVVPLSLSLCVSLTPSHVHCSLMYVLGLGVQEAVYFYWLVRQSEIDSFQWFVQVWF
jgi:hypothetical protein